MTCIACSYFSSKNGPPSERNLIVPRKKKPDETGK
jgi:hypothetical protein